MRLHDARSEFSMRCERANSKMTQMTDEQNPKSDSFPAPLLSPETLSASRSRDIVATLLGMALVIGSLKFAWQRQSLQEFTLLPALYAQSNGIKINGFGAHLTLPLTLCAVVCGTTLFWTPSGTNRLALAMIQAACGVACLSIAASHFAILPGVVLAVCGGSALLYGACERARPLFRSD